MIELVSDESDEELKKLTNSMSMFSRDISKFKESKGLDKYRPKERAEVPYRQRERFEDRYQQPEKHDDRIIRQKYMMIVIVQQKDMTIAIVQQRSTTIVTDKTRVSGEATNLGMTTAKVDTAVTVTEAKMKEKKITNKRNGT